jgi:hypothetical protein
MIANKHNMANQEEESIYQLLPPQQPVLVRPPMYRSKVRMCIMTAAAMQQQACSMQDNSSTVVLAVHDRCCCCCPACLPFLHLQHPGELSPVSASRRVRPAATMGRPQVRSTTAAAATSRLRHSSSAPAVDAPTLLLSFLCMHVQGQYADHPSAFLHKHSKEPVLPERTYLC